MAKDKVRKELEEIQASARGKILRPAEVISWARKHPRSALHRQFDWNDSRAAEKYRVLQARWLIRLIITVEEKEPVFVSLTCDRQSGGGYRDIPSVLNNRELSEIMLNDAIADLERARGRYKLVKELTSVWIELDKVVEKRIPSKKKKAA